MADGSFDLRDKAAQFRTVPMSLWPEALRNRRTMLQLAAARAEKLLDDLVTKLDALEPDADLEVEPDFEATLGIPESSAAWGLRPRTLGDDFDMEEQCEGGGGEEGCEDEGAQCDGGGGEDACEDEGCDSDTEQVNEDGDDCSDGPVPNYASHHDQRTPAGGYFSSPAGVY